MGWFLVVNAGMQAAVIVIVDGQFDQLPCQAFALQDVMDQVFMLQGIEEALYFGIVIAVVFPCEAYRKAMGLELFQISIGTILAAMV